VGPADGDSGRDDGRDDGFRRGDSGRLRFLLGEPETELSTVLQPTEAKFSGLGHPEERVLDFVATARVVKPIEVRDCVLVGHVLLVADERDVARERDRGGNRAALSIYTAQLADILLPRVARVVAPDPVHERWCPSYPTHVGSDGFIVRDQLVDLVGMDPSGEACGCCTACRVGTLFALAIPCHQETDRSTPK
jgi:hypothetical protein